MSDGKRSLVDNAAQPRVVTRPNAAEPPPDAQAAPGPAEAAEDLPASLDDVLTDEICLLRVEPTTWEGKEAFHLHFHHQAFGIDTATHPYDVRNQLRSALSIVTLTQSDNGTGRPLRDAFHEIMTKWASMATLQSWIRRLLDQPGAKPKLIIWDETGYEIPWELLHCSSEPGGGWLGELVPVTRWVQTLDGTPPWSKPPLQTGSAGGMLLHEDPSLGEPLPYYGTVLGAASASVSDLIARLEIEPDDFSLVLIRAHGDYGQKGDSRVFTVGDTTLNSLTERGFQQLRRTRAVVFLNACVAGRIIQDQRFGDSTARGFVEVFLRKGASAVIAAAGDIDIEYSRSFANRFVSSAMSAPLNIADDLHKHRRQRAQRVRLGPGAKDDRSENDFRRFFSAFTYVVYGHPDTTFRLKGTT